MFLKDLDAFLYTRIGSEIRSGSEDEAKMHDPQILKIHNEDEITAVLLVSDFETCKKLDQLVSLVVFEQSLEQEGNNLTVNEYCWNENPPDEGTWVSRWISIHEEQYTIVRTSQLLKSCDLDAKSPVSGLGEGMFTCLSVVLIWNKKAKTSIDRGANTLVRDLDSLLKSFQRRVRRGSSSSTGLFEKVLRLDGLLRSNMRGSERHEKRVRKYKHFCDDYLSSCQSVTVECDVFDKLKGLEEKLLSNDWQSLSIARSFASMLINLDELPMNVFRIVLEELKKKIDDEFSDAFLFLELISPIVKLRDFFIQFMMLPGNLTDSKFWMKGKSIDHFISHLVSFYVDLIGPQAENEMIRIRRDESLERFDEWQAALDELISVLDLSPKNLEDNDLDEIFLKAKGVYSNIKKADSIVEDAASVTSEILESRPSLAQLLVYDESQRLQQQMEHLKKGYMDFWSKVKNSVKNPSSALLKEIRSAVNELAMVIQSNVLTGLAIAKFENRLRNLKQAFASISGSKTRTEDSSVPTEYVDLINKRLECLNSSEFEIVDQESYPLSIEPNEVIQMLNALHSSLTNDDNDGQVLKPALEILTSAIKCSWKQQVWTHAIQLCKDYSEANDLSGKQQVLEQLSCITLIPSSLSMRLAFHAKSVEECDELYCRTMYELVQLKSEFLMKDYMTSMEYWNSERLQESVKHIKELSNGTNVTIKEINSQFQSISKCHNKLQRILSEHTDSQESPITLMLPVLSKDDVLSIFADDVHTVITTINEDKTSMDASSSNVTYSYKSEDGSRVQIFDMYSISNLVAAGVSIRSDKEDEDYNEIWAEASLSLCTVVFSWMLRSWITLQVTCS